MGRRIFSVKYATIVLLTVTVLVLGALNARQKRIYIPPDDGASWIQGSGGVQARIVAPDGPADKAGIRPGDVLKAINGRMVRSDLHVTQVLYGLGTWSKATYTIVRDEKEIETTLITNPIPLEFLRRQEYLEVIGLIYLLVGFFVLIKRS